MNLFGVIGLLAWVLFLGGPWYVFLAGRSIREPAFLLGWLTALVVGFVASMVYLGATARRKREFREIADVAAATAAQRQTVGELQVAEHVGKVQAQILEMQTELITTLTERLAQRGETAAADETPEAA